MSKKQTMFLIIIFIICFCVLSISAGLAMFTLDVSFDTQRDKATAATMPILIFNAGNAINIEANSFNFVVPGHTLTSETTSTATLIAGSDNRLVQDYYDLKINLERNDFIYTKNPQTPELLLIITNPEGEVVRDLANLEFVSVDGYEGFDITGKEGIYEVTTNHLIETTSQTVHNWNIKIAFVNYDHNQDTNRGKYLVGKILIGKTGEI